MWAGIWPDYGWNPDGYLESLHNPYRFLLDIHPPIHLEAWLVVQVVEYRREYVDGCSAGCREEKVATQRDGPRNAWPPEQNDGHPSLHAPERTPIELGTDACTRMRALLHFHRKALREEEEEEGSSRAGYIKKSRAKTTAVVAEERGAREISSTRGLNSTSSDICDAPVCRSGVRNCHPDGNRRQRPSPVGRRK